MEDDGVRPEPGWRSRLAAHRKRLAAHPRVLGAAVTAAVLLAAFLLWPRTDGPGDVVRGYLDAIRHQKIAEALRIAKAERPSGQAATFLTGQAIGGGWTIGELTVESDVDGAADVSVVFTDTTGPPPQYPGQFAGRFHLRRAHGGWRIDNPFIQTTFDDLPLWYVGVNGVRLAREDGSAKYSLFPGIYQTYVTHSDVVTVIPGRLYALPDNTWVPDTRPKIRVTDQGNRSFQRASDAFLNRCLARQALPHKDCTVRVRGDAYEPGDDEALWPSDLTASTWTVLRYPTVNLPGTLDRAGTGRTVLRGQVAIPGEVHLAATGIDLDHRRVSFAMTCLVMDEGLAAGITSDGSLAAATLTTMDWIEIDCY